MVWPASNLMLTSASSCLPRDPRPLDTYHKYLIIAAGGCQRLQLSLFKIFDRNVKLLPINRFVQQKSASLFYSFFLRWQFFLKRMGSAHFCYGWGWSQSKYSRSCPKCWDFYPNVGYIDRNGSDFDQDARDFDENFCNFDRNDDFFLNFDINIAILTEML